jgi:hypothetical protein
LLNILKGTLVHQAVVVAGKGVCTRSGVGTAYSELQLYAHASFRDSRSGLAGDTRQHQDADPCPAAGERAAPPNHSPAMGLGLSHRSGARAAVASVAASQAIPALGLNCCTIAGVNHE